MMIIVNDAKALLKSQNINQWQTGYPNQPLLEQDIREGIGFVLETDGEIAGMCAVTFGAEECYNKIENGSWLTEGENYAVVHRMAVGSNYHRQNLPAVMFAEIEKKALKNNAKSMRADTHPENPAMQRTLLKQGFEFCGKIHLIGGEEDGQERIGFEKIL